MKILMKPFLALLQADPAVALTILVMLAATGGCMLVSLIVPVLALLHG